MQEYYKILDITQDATDEQVEARYNMLKEKYSKERFLEGQAGNDAAKNLTKLETAYHEIIESRKCKNSADESSSYNFSEVEELIKKGDITSAQQKLDDITERNAEWHYLQSVVFYKKNWMNESKKQLEIALTMEPHNVKYSEDFEKLKKKIEFNERQFKSNGHFGNDNNEDVNNRQMGAGADSCMSFCTTWCCMNMLCNMCCR